MVFKQEPAIKRKLGLMSQTNSVAGLMRHDFGDIQRIPRKGISEYEARSIVAPPKTANKCISPEVWKEIFKTLVRRHNDAHPFSFGCLIIHIFIISNDHIERAEIFSHRFHNCIHLIWS